MTKFKMALLGLFAVLALWACGGGGGSSASGVAVRAFASDDLNTNYAHVWVKIKKIDLTSTSGSSVTLFDESATGGRTVDLRTLHDSTGARFLLLCGFNIPAGQYTGATITMDKNLTVVATGQTTGVDAVFAGAGATDMLFTTTFSPVFDPALKNKLVLDFDLAAWTLNSDNTVTASGGAFVKHGDDTGIDDDTRHEHDDYNGTVSNLAGTAPTQTFTLTRRSRTITVTTDATTVVFNNDGSANPALANAQHVEVTGNYDATTDSILATKVKIEVTTESDSEDQVKGLVTADDATAGTLTLTIDGAHGFVPSGTSIIVGTTGTTKFFGTSGIEMTATDFFAALSLNVSSVEVEGTVQTDGSITAKRIKIEDGEQGGGGGDDHHHHVSVKGPISNFDGTAKTFDVTLTGWEGANLSKGTVVHVTASTLPDGLANGNKVEAEGTLNVDTLTLTATKVQKDN